jgi:endonuclease YncB( thermonuclease family)
VARSRTNPASTAQGCGWFALLALLPVGMLASCLADPTEPPRVVAALPTPTVRVTTPTTAIPTPAGATAAATVAAAASSESITVQRVKDGDSFVLADDREVRVLGIDSCEMGTYGGEQAKSEAETLLSDATLITLRTEPGVTVDRYGRLLRYVNVYTSRGQVDFGEEMVANDHTGIYTDGHNDASPQYLERLYAADLKYALNPPVGRNCADPNPDSSGGGGSVNNGDDDDHRNRRGGGPCGRWNPLC